jgi:uncharacterized protein (TIGR03118 family)
MRARVLSTVVAAACVWGAVSTTAQAQVSEQAQFYAQHNLVSDVPGAADRVDPLLVNAWGLVAGPTTPWWVADNGSDSSTLYTGAGMPVPLIVSVPGAPTGIVFNSQAGVFLVNGSAARFIFATEDGTILGWNGGTSATIIHPSDGGIYKGLAIDQTPGHARLYVTDFHGGHVDVYDGNLTELPDSFEDPTIPPGYAPFGIANLNGTIFVTYALQDDDAEDDVPGAGHGFVNAFDTDGHFIGRVASGNELNSPWGLAWAPDGFGKFSGHLLVGNFGDGAINAFDPRGTRRGDEYRKAGFLHGTNGAPLRIDGLWALAFGTGSAASGPTTTLFFTAGPEDESHGLFGTLTVGHPSDR